MTMTTELCHVYEAPDNKCKFCGNTPEDVMEGVHNLFAEQAESPVTTTVKQIQISCVAATVNDTIVAVADDLNLDYVFAMIFAVCQYRELKLADANIRFFRANAGTEWDEDHKLREFFTVADIPDLVDMNKFFQKFEDFREQLSTVSLEEIFPYAIFTDVTEIDGDVLPEL